MGIVINSSTGEIDVAASTPGTYRITYTTSNCVNSSTQDITINALPTVAISGTLSYCNGSNTTLTATAGLSSYLWSTGATTQAINVTAGSYTVTGTDANGCSATSSSVTVTELPLDDASFSYSANSYCQNAASNPTTTPATPGGTFSSTSGLVFADSGSNTGSSTGEINLAASTVGNYVVTYNTPSGNACPNSSTQNVEVLAADVVSLSYPASSYPQSGTDPSPTFSPSGGTFSATPSGLSINSSTGVIDLSASSVNSYTITYTSGGTCSDTASFNLSIISISAAFNYSASAYCQDASDPTPTVTGTSGGAFSAALKAIPFQMQFKVASGTQKTISIPGVYGSSFTIDWGDGFTETSTGSGNRIISHTYNDGNNNDVNNPTVSIGATGDTGAFNRFSFASSGGSGADLLDIPQWGNIVWQGFNSIFTGCNNIDFQISATDAPDLSNITDMSYTFYNATYFNSNIEHWDVSTITTLSNCFRGCNNYNQSLNSWDVSNVKNFSLMFYNTVNGSFNGNISSWDMSSCETTSNMFYKQTSFNQDISGWNFSSSWTNASYMFYNLSSFNQNLNSWNVSNVQRMDGMFRGCTNFNNNGGTLSGWNVGSATRMDRMFQSASSFAGTGVDSWNPSSCTRFDVMFYSASVFNQNLSSWSLNSSLTNAASMFVGTNAFTTENYSDTVVGWAVFVYNNSGNPSSVSWVGTKPNFDGYRTSDSASGQTYAAKYGSNWPTGWTDSQDAFDYLTTTLSWTIN